MENMDAVSTSDERQPFHRVNGKMINQREWRENLKLSVEILADFKRQAYKDKVI